MQPKLPHSLELHPAWCSITDMNTTVTNHKIDISRSKVLYWYIVVFKNISIQIGQFLSFIKNITIPQHIHKSLCWLICKINNSTPPNSCWYTHKYWSQANNKIKDKLSTIEQLCIEPWTEKQRLHLHSHSADMICNITEFPYLLNTWLLIICLSLIIIVWFTVDSKNGFGW